FLAVSGLIYFLARRPGLVRKLVWLPSLVIDLPLAFVFFWRYLPGAEVPRAVGAFAIGVFLTIVVGSFLSMNRALVAGVALATCVAESILVLVAGSPRAAPALVIMICADVGMIGIIAVTQMRALIRSTVEDEAVRERVGRYFSPAVRQ